MNLTRAQIVSACGIVLNQDVDATFAIVPQEGSDNPVLLEVHHGEARGSNYTIKKNGSYVEHKS